MVNSRGYLDCKEKPEIMAFRNCVLWDKEEGTFNRCVYSCKYSLEIS
jgi:hypothetical protein